VLLTSMGYSCIDVATLGHLDGHKRAERIYAARRFCMPCIRSLLYLCTTPSIHPSIHPSILRPSMNDAVDAPVLPQMVHLGCTSWAHAGSYAPATARPW
jgi:hypothetical protein